MRRDWRYFGPYVMRIGPRPAGVVMAAAGPGLPGGFPVFFFLAHMMGDHSLGAATVMVAIPFRVGLRGLGHC